MISTHWRIESEREWHDMFSDNTFHLIFDLVVILLLALFSICFLGIAGVLVRVWKLADMW